MRSLLAFLMAALTVGAFFALTGSIPAVELPGEPAGTPTAAPPPPAPPSYATFVGGVRDESGRPLQWAAVTVDGYTAFTDEDGRFEIETVLAGATATIEANGHARTTVAATGTPADVRLGTADPAVLTVDLRDGPADLSIYDAFTLARVAYRGGLDGSGPAAIAVAPGSYLVVAEYPDSISTSSAVVPRRGTTVAMNRAAGTGGGPIVTASGRVMSASGKPIDPSITDAWVVSRAPSGSRTLVPIEPDGSFRLNVVSDSILQAFVFDAAAQTIAASGAIEADAGLTLVPGPRSRLDYAITASLDRSPANTCGFGGVVPRTGALDPLFERALLRRGAPADTGEVVVTAASLGSMELISMFDARTGRVLARAWAGRGYEPASIDTLLWEGLRAAELTRRPVSGRIVTRTDPSGDRYLGVVDVRTGSGSAPPDGTPIELAATAGTVTGATSTRLLVAGGRTQEVRWTPPTGWTDGPDVTFSARHACGGTLATRTISLPSPGTLSFAASFAQPVSSEACAAGIPFEAAVTIELTRGEEGATAVTIPIANGPILAGWYDAESGDVQAKGDADGVYWRIDATIDGAGISGTLTVTVTGTGCDRTDKYAFTGTPA